ncbi:ABC transporter ATP-binding protein [Umezawaea sp.]|uniref:energy-coupling factor ABC transporter ATP-binding protein n=1 Tax=Umezawaea sp. TaxID=1955258 RepID=UPI002ED4D712
MRSDIRVESLTFRYDERVTALDDVSLVVRQGERVAVIGPNGAGKTTLAQHFNGMVKPTSGRVLVGDLDTAEHPIAVLAAKVGFVFQNPNDQLHAKTVSAEVHFGPRNLGFPPEHARHLVERALESTGLTDLADAHPHHLSLAQRKMVAIAGVLAMDTPVVVLDEPTTGQDSVALDALATIIADLSLRGRTVIAITHDMDFCVENFDRVVLVADGRIVEDGTPAEVFAGDRVARLPQVVRLGRELGWSEQVTTVDGFVDHLAVTRG